ncbi:HAD-IC family P-type ATPase [Jiangella rhizosphaerae]|uniref:HAD family hydrolase n=1 Tax=Jiangella rhizosphaerae TaxID=2293569 RepID=A0A418KJA6_9ACTN|nr:HAD-IC family P-type ATPase [Jiangella rhizosphaerae]RIQ13749.1 HAD family hydrolase [Jiangella rhizosphaerae]
MTSDRVTAPADSGRGLTAAEVAARVAAGQTNDVPARASRGVWEIVRGNVFTRINAILAVLFVLVLSTGSILDGLFGTMIVANSVVGLVQELRAKRTLDRLTIVGQARPRVRRDGAVVELAPNEVVADDVIEMSAGDQVVVDGEVVVADALEVDESLLTGESDPVVKHTGDPVMSGSFVVAGNGAYRATKVGREAYAARLAEEASRFTLVNSDLRNGVNTILRFITYLLIPAGALSIYNQLSGNQDLPEALRGMVAALVPMVPEGLVLMLSIAFAVGVVRLGRRQCLVNELPAIEGLARVDVVCADKTGTLTENAMRLAEVRDLDGDPAGVRTALGALAAADPRPNASLRAIAEAHPDGPGWPVTGVAPFSSARKWSGASFDGHGHWVLGAPDVLLPAGDATRDDAERTAAQGLRVLLLGRSDQPVDAAGAPGAVTPSALLVLDQKVRPDAKDTLAYFAEQDVTVKVISGDNAASVGAVAASLGLPGATRTVDARTLPEERDALAGVLDENAVFGRVTPDQKRAMVGALQSRGHTVAMTGDGVNDVLALKDADIGVAMGAGSPATRSVAQIVLLDNKFATLPHVVAEGRRVIGNIERVATLFLTKTVYSVLLAFMVGVPGLIGFDPLPYPFFPRHVTITGWFTIGVPAFVLSLAPNAERARPGFVSRVMRTSVPAGIVIGVACFVAYVLTYDGEGSGAARTQASTTALITLTIIALWVLAIVARPYAPWKIALVVVMAASSALMFLLPLTQELFLLDPGNTGFTVIGLSCAAAGVVLVELIWAWSGRDRQAGSD